MLEKELNITMIKDKKEKTMTFRLTNEEYEWLEKASYSMGSTPSKFVRQLINMSINAQKAAEEVQAKTISAIAQKNMNLEMHK